MTKARVKNRWQRMIALLGLLMLGSGADCRHFLWSGPQPGPAILHADPTLAEVIAAVDANRSRAMSLYATQATLSGSGFPSMRASLAIGNSPRQMRLRAGTGLTGSELDLGSNDQLFWLWIKRNQPPVTLVAEHERFAASPAARAFPIRPEWLVEAIGLVYLDPQAPHVGPLKRTDGRLEIHTPVQTPTGQQTKILILDASSAYVYEQHLVDERGQVIASAINSRHMRDSLTGLVLPRDTVLRWPALGLNLRLEIDELQVNPLDLTAEMWTKPLYPGFPDTDIASMLGPPATAGAYAPRAGGVSAQPISAGAADGGWRPAQPPGMR